MKSELILVLLLTYFRRLTIENERRNSFGLPSIIERDMDILEKSFYIDLGDTYLEADMERISLETDLIIEHEEKEVTPRSDMSQTEQVVSYCPTSEKRKTIGETHRKKSIYFRRMFEAFFEKFRLIDMFFDFSGEPCS